MTDSLTITEFYTALRALDEVASMREFSVKYLGRSASYAANLRYSRGPASRASIMLMEARLWARASSLERFNDASMMKRRVKLVLLAHRASTLVDGFDEDDELDDPASSPWGA